MTIIRLTRNTSGGTMPVYINVDSIASINPGRTGSMVTFTHGGTAEMTEQPDEILAKLTRLDALNMLHDDTIG